MKPLLAHVYEPHRVTYPCYVQPKLNGIRALYQNGFFQSRDEVPFPPGLLDHLAKPLLSIFEPSVILDGELYVHGWPLQRIMGAVTPVRQEPTEDTVKVEYHVFDRVDFSLPFCERINLPQKKFPIATDDFPIFFVFTRLVSSQVQADFHYANFIEHNFEGMMYRLGDCPYTVPKQRHAYPLISNPGKGGRILKFLSDQDNRVWHLLKRKDFQDDEFLITEFNATTGPKGERGFQLHLITSSGKRFASGGGLTQMEIDHYLSNDPTGRKAKIKYLVLSSDGIPTGNPTILAIL